MLLSISHRFIFVHVNKAAGTSMIAALEQFGHNPPTDPLSKGLAKVGLVRDYRRRYFPVHTTASQLRRQLPAEVWDGFFKFAFVRNPWDWLVSTYHYLGTTKAHRHHRRVSAMGSFGEYVDWEIERARRSQSGFVCEDDGVIVDYIGRFETLADDYEEICRRIGVKAPPLPHVNRTVHRGYREMYDDALIARVAEHWRFDIELFGYEFNGLRADARRNFP
ncbi:MAG: sulfotransferase family protein [Gammaproteobacteria bacterium]|nr:sulfotransferase family protein [Gammaproteobacteria bacterium]MDH4254332.1 sulfotransferase family protein [Gammaproteobacteria bacterium]MDH5309616.1 sulfotransferase family protein [Gammaproteobacteria bacterium]